LALEKLRRVWKNDYFQTAIVVILMLLIVFGFWYGSQLVLNTPYPALVVVSDSMQPTLNVGDIIIVQGVSASQIHANPINGDIIVFAFISDPSFRIVHRAISVNNSDGTWTITTHGDNNALGTNEYPNSNSAILIGKVIGVVPYVGNFSIFVSKIGDFYFFVLIIIIIIGILLSLLTGGEEKESVENKPSEEKLFGNLNMRTVVKGLKIVAFIILNLILVGLIIFSLFGSFTFYQIGADPQPENVTIRGIYPNLQYYISNIFPHGSSPGEYIVNASFSLGFLTYAINCYVLEGSYGGMRSGVPAFSWTQFLFLILLIFDIWNAVSFLQQDKKRKSLLKPKTEPDFGGSGNLNTPVGLRE
jgi:signal peptidase